MSTQHLGIDDEDFWMDMVPGVEKSFGFLFQKQDLAHVRTFGEFCEAVSTKISTPSVHDCTTQQAFYKLRKALNAQLPDVAIEPTTALAAILPASGWQRRRIAAAVEAEVGFKLNVLGIDMAAEAGGLLLLLGSGITAFFNGYVGGMGLAFSFAFFYFANKLGSTIKIEKVRDVIEQMSTQPYRQSRRNPDTVNRTEIPERLRHMFVQDFGLELATLTHDALLF